MSFELVLFRLAFKKTKRNMCVEIQSVQIRLEEHGFEIILFSFV